VGYGEKAVVSDVNVTLPGGRITVILGGSGSGKSTLLKHILRLHRPIAGRVTIGGHDIFNLSRKALRCLKQRLGLLFQDGALLGSLTLFDNIALPLREHTRLKEKAIAEIVRAKAGLVGLADFLGYFPNQLSGGMRKRAGLARAMVMDPEILFCDEPTSGLDPVNSAALDDLLLELKRRFDMTRGPVPAALPGAPGRGERGRDADPAQARPQGHEDRLQQVPGRRRPLTPAKERP